MRRQAPSNRSRAFAWVRAHTKDHGSDPDAIFLCGHSAGGHLVALLATDGCYLKDEDRRANRGVIGVSGVYNIPPRDAIARVMAGMMSGLTMAGPCPPRFRRRCTGSGCPQPDLSQMDPSLGPRLRIQ